MKKFWKNLKVNSVIDHWREKTENPLRCKSNYILLLPSIGYLQISLKLVAFQNSTLKGPYIVRNSVKVAKEVNLFSA